MKFFLSILFSSICFAQSIDLGAGNPITWLYPVPTAALLPVSGNILGDAVIANDTQVLYVWNGSGWTAVASPAAAIAITALIGDVTATGPGAAVATLATVNSNVGPFGTASSVGSFTVNGKGLITAANNTSIQIAESQVTNLVSDLASKQGTITIGVLDAQAGNANGLALVANVLSSQSASNTNPGMVNNTTQTLSGNKSLNGTLFILPSSTTALEVGASAGFIFDSTNSTVGIGLQPATNTAIDVVNSNGTSKAIQGTSYGVSSTIPFRGRFARGTSSSPTAALSTDILSVFSGRGYGATGFTAASTGAINILAEGTFTDTSAPTAIQFMYTPSASVTAVEGMRLTAFGLLGVNKISPAAMIEADSNGVSQPIMILKEIASQTADALDIENSSNTKLFNVSAAGNVGISAAIATAGVGLNFVLPVAASSAAKGLSLSQTTVAVPATATVENISLTTDTSAYAGNGTMSGTASVLINSKPATGNSGSVTLNGISESTQLSTVINTASTPQTYNNYPGSFIALVADSVSGTSNGITINNSAVRASILDEMQHASSGANTEINVAVDASVGDFLSSAAGGTLTRTDYGVRSNIAGKTGAHYVTTGYGVWASSTGHSVADYDFYAASGSPSFFKGPVQLLHEVGNGGTISFTAGAGAGTGPTVLGSGTDLSGAIVVITGTLPTASAVIGTLNFVTAYTANTVVQLTAANANSALLSGVTGVFVTGATTNFTLNSGPTGLTPATTYLWYYHVSQ